MSRTRIGVRRLVTHRRHASRLEQMHQHIPRPAGRMRHAIAIQIGHRRAVRPAPVPVRPQRHEGARRNDAVPRLPARHIAQHRHAVRVLPDPGADVDDHQRQDHLGDRQLVQAPAARDEMDRRIDMRAPLPTWV